MMALPDPPKVRKRGRQPRKPRDIIAKLDDRRSGMQRTAEPADPKTDERQTRVYDLSVQGFTKGQIASLLKISRDLVARDILFEATRRAAERRAAREAIIEQSVGRYEKVISDVSLRVQKLVAIAEGQESWKAQAALRSIIPREMRIFLQAQKQAEEVQGLLETVSVTVNNNNAGAIVTASPATEMLLGLDADERAAIREKARAARESEAAAAMRNVTPA